MAEQYIEAFKDLHKGKSCAILGGGTSLPYDMRKLPPVDLLFGVNQHSMIAPLDYLVFVDTKMWPYVKDYPATLITRSPKIVAGDQDIIKVRQTLVHNYSGALALYAADYFGIEKIYVCGVDQYEPTEDQRYYWWEGPQTLERQKDRKIHDAPRQMKMFVDTLRRPHNVYFVSGEMAKWHQGI